MRHKFRVINGGLDSRDPWVQHWPGSLEGGDDGSESWVALIEDVELWVNGSDARWQCGFQKNGYWVTVEATFPSCLDAKAASMKAAGVSDGLH